jgi:hypothetical protein
MVVEQLSWDASVPYNDKQYFWHNGDGIPYLYENTENENDKIKTFDTLVKSYITHPIFEDTGFGVNAYAPGNCVGDNNMSNLCDRFCGKYAEYYKSITCYNEICKEEFKDKYETNSLKLYDKEWNNRGSLYLGTCVWEKVSGPHIKCEEVSPNIDIGQSVCDIIDNDMHACSGSFYEMDPPLNSNILCSGIEGCKRKYYNKYLKYLRETVGISAPLFISEIGSQSSEYSAYSASYSTGSFEWSFNLQKTLNIYGVTNIRDYQEQVDMLEGDVMVFLGDNYLRQNKKLKGVIIFSDDLLPEGSQLFWYNFPPTGKPLDKFIPLLTGKGVK